MTDEQLHSAAGDALAQDVWLPAGGAMAIIDADSHEALTEILSAYPLQPWVGY